jgi:hypothetical protein
MSGRPYRGQGGASGGFHDAELAGAPGVAGFQMIRARSRWLRNADITVFLGSLAVLDLFRVYSDSNLPS